MIIFELTNTEKHPVYEALEVANGNRHYDFLQSIVGAVLAMDRQFLSQHVIKALNFHAITCLHTNPGEYRPCEVRVNNHTPPQHHRVQALMDDLVNMVNRGWETTDPVVLATFVLWRLNWIHPFVNGNGRTARAAAYFILCVKSGGWLRGEKILPELLRGDRDRYVEALAAADASLATNLDLSQLHALVSELLEAQLASSPEPSTDAPGDGGGAGPVIEGPAAG
ncbi:MULTISPECIES: Fic family protein [unclassified Beijerinckia]|uniref:Fic family protein n=1 Tax=unclassified Beijerinckia TaxID=2638183 RepID=UPI0008969289|nr:MULTISPECIES: Fic family protein [unclassified Beijerinckia]MDH7797496.1 prophage maintenance system killer protein [Beijerinckia sp. GAS462]SEC87960.1 Fic/DOC family protein [Beijerinckia sp. 28-YEA-48]